MADNFDLRQFLTENKLTKNTQLLAEGSDYGYEVLMDVVDTEYDGDPAIAAAVEDAFNNGDIDTSEFGHDLNAPSNAVAQIANGMDIEAAQQSMGFEEGVEDLEEFSPYGSMAFSGEKQKENEKAPLSSLEVGDLVYVKGVSQGYVVVKDKKEDGTVGVGDPHNDRISYQDGNKEAEVIKRASLKEASYKASSNSKEAQHLKKGDIVGSGDEVVSVSAGAKTPSGKVEVTLKTKSGKTKVSTWGKTTKVGLKAKETVKENTMTKRDQYLTRLVENALGMQPSDDDEMEFNPADDADERDYRRDQYLGNQMEEGDDNVDYTMGRQDDPNQLPNPAPELNIPEGEDMVQEKPLPKYENIEKLMQEIEHGTNEAACKYKMDEMKRVYEALEKKVSSLEEGEHAEYTDKKAINQMRKDIAALRKAEEKLRKDFDKKFNKEKKESPKKEKEKETVTLAESTNTMENFNLKKFLIENKLTTNSRMLNEELKFIDANDPARNKGGNENLKLTDLQPGKTVIALNRHYSNREELEDEAGTFIEVDEEGYIRWKTKSGKEKVWKYIDDIAIVTNL